MAHYINQHDPKPDDSENVRLTGDQFLALLNRKVALSDEQFGTLVMLLKPGYELSMLYLAQARAENEKRFMPAIAAPDSADPSPAQPAHEEPDAIPDAVSSQTVADKAD